MERYDLLFWYTMTFFFFNVFFNVDFLRRMVLLRRTVSRRRKNKQVAPAVVRSGKEKLLNGGIAETRDNREANDSEKFTCNKALIKTHSIGSTLGQGKKETNEPVPRVVTKVAPLFYLNR